MPYGMSTAFDLRQIATPGRTVPAGTTMLYTKSDGLLYRKVGSTEFPVDTSSGVYTPSPVVDLNSSSTISVPSATWTVVTGWSGMGAYISGFTGGIATFNTAGMFLMIATASIATSGANAGRRQIALMKNSVEERRQDYGNAPIGPVTLFVSTIMTMQVGDTAHVQVFQASGSTLALASTHRWQIWRLSGDTAFA